jgi:hypothetical protein
MFVQGVDLVDQQRQEYLVHKWWHKVFLFILDSWILNCYILYAEDTWTLGLVMRTRQLFHYNLEMSLVTPLLQLGRVSRLDCNLAPPGFHRLKDHPTKRDTYIVYLRWTRKFCGSCYGRFMCEIPCYVLVHT